MQRRALLASALAAGVAPIAGCTLTPENIRVLRSASYGGNGGSPFEDPPLPLDAYLSSMHISSGQQVDSLSPVYRRTSTPNVSSNTDFYGGAGGSSQDVSFSGRRLIGISGRAGDYVDSMQLLFDTGPPSPRFGGGGGGSEYLIMPPQPDLVVIGLYGRSGAKIDRIGLLYRYRLA